MQNNMKRLENHCVDCGLPCMGLACPYYYVPVYYCDECGEDGAVYHIEDQDLCAECAEHYLDSAFQDLSFTEKAEALHIDFSNTEGE